MQDEVRRMNRVRYAHMMIARPAVGDHAEFFQGYIDLVPQDDVLVQLASQGRLMQERIGNATEQQGNHRYADGKWTVKQVVQHVIDGERLFGYRALCIARGDRQSLPGFDENAYAEQDGSAARNMASLAEEHGTVRAATLSLYGGFDGAVWQRRGLANGQSIAVRALPWITAGHELHHVAVLQERYGLRFGPAAR